jgi:hypothetical protein
MLHLITIKKKAGDFKEVGVLLFIFLFGFRLIIAFRPKHVAYYF